MLKVGLTGGIGSGKSTASNFFNELGAFVLDADTEAKNMISANEVVQHELISEFGTDIINAAGKIDKEKLARVAFQDVDHQRRLNSVVHPYIYDLIDNSYEKILSDGKHSVFIIDAAMIYESGYDIHLDYIIVITAQLKNRMERALARNTLTREEILKRIEFQWTEEEKVGMADFVIHNDGSKKELNANIKSLIKKLI